MKRIYDDLWQTSLEQPFSGLNTHAYFLRREEGNVLFYNTSNVDDLEEISTLGGLAFQYLSHRHESGKSLDAIKSKFKSQLCAGSLEVPFVETSVDVTFSTRQSHSSNIEIIPTPGHTDGGLCFYYESPIGLRYLFTGDSLFQSNARWDTLVFSNDGGNAENLIESLSTIRTLEPDVVLCSASVGEISVVEVTKVEWRDAIDSNINKLGRA
jgi:hydroxyacylglutathione hydrolase